MPDSFSPTLPTDAGPDTVPTEAPPDSRINPRTGPASLSPSSRSHGPATDSRPTTSMLMAHEQQRLHFSGTGQEYFRIWVINLALTVLTLGVYSAWAKIRRLRYFYRNTRLDGASFDYTATPGAVLLGRVLALLLFLAFYGAFQWSAWAGGVATLAAAAALPALMWQANRFRARNTVYRGLAFGFDGSLREAYITYALPLLVLFAPSVLADALLARGQALWVVGLSAAAALTLPYFHAQLRRYLQRNLRYGDAAFGFEPTLRDFAQVWLRGLLLAALIIGAAVIALTVGGYIVGAVSRRTGAAPLLMALLSAAVVVLAYAALASYYTARFQKLVWEGSAVDDMAFRCNISARRLLRMQVSNTLLTIVTLGLYRPFAAVKVAKYRVESMAIVGAEHLGTFHRGSSATTGGATGDAAAPLFDLDIGL